MAAVLAERRLAVAAELAAAEAELAMLLLVLWLLLVGQWGLGAESFFAVAVVVAVPAAFQELLPKSCETRR